MEQEKIYRLGIDIGGTFTDLTVINERDHTTLGVKTPTVPLHPEQGVVNGLHILREKYGVDPSQIRYFVHGTTIGLNTLLQRKGAKLALFVTEGFRDILTMQRMRLPVPYDFHSRLPEPLIPRSLVYGIKERTLANGAEETAIDYESLDKAIEQATEQGVQGIAICFLHSYINPKHENQAKEYIIRKAPDIKVCTSSEIWPEMREYERAIISVVNLYIQKNVEEYFDNLKRVLQKEGLTVQPFITQSNGGIMNLDSAAAAPVKTLFSGPAAGVIGAINEALKSGKNNLLTFDMGGTSTDISIVSNGEASIGQSSVLSGFPIVIPSIDIESIGAGGGSIVWIDNGGMLKVGPESAGSDPGPACYGKSEIPTLTDAFLICGYLNPKRFAAGSMELDVERSKKAYQVLAQKLGKEVQVLADQVIQIAIANMYAQLSNVMEQKGFDPRELTIMAYGGGGPVTANFVAEEIHARNILIPYRPGTLCAMGALSASFVYDAVSALQENLSQLDSKDICRVFKELTSQAKEWLAKQNSSLQGEKTQISFLADARYSGQSYEIQIPLQDTDIMDESTDRIAELFHKQHEKLYGHFEADADIELVSLRARIVAETPSIPSMQIPESVGMAEPIENRDIYMNGCKYETPIYDRSAVKAGQYILGPAVVEQDDTTIVVLPHWKGIFDNYGNFLMEREDA